MSVSFSSDPMAVKLRGSMLRPLEFIRTYDGEDDYVFELYAVDGDKALILNEHSLEWVDLDRVFVILAGELKEPKVEESEGDETES